MLLEEKIINFCLRVRKKGGERRGEERRGKERIGKRERARREGERAKAKEKWERGERDKT